MSLEQVWVLGVIGGAFLLLVTEWTSTGVTGVLVLAALALGQLVFPEGDLAGHYILAYLTNEAVVAVAAMFVISAGIQRTGAVGIFANVIMDRPGSRPERIYVAVLVLVMVASAFMNNTPLVLIFMPLVIGLSDRMGDPPSKRLIPLSFISIMGGMCTLVGTSTNLVVNSTLRRSSGGEFSLGMFDFLWGGIPLALAGSLVLFLFGRRLLPSRASLGLTTDKGLATEYMTELVIHKGSTFIGQTLAEAFPASPTPKPTDVRVLQVIRNDVIRPAIPTTVLQDGDLLLVKGNPATIIRFHNREDTGVIPALNIDAEPETAREVALTLAEVVLTPNSRWIGRRVLEIHFRERYGVSVFAVQRHGEHLREKVDELRLKAGDILLVQGSPESLRNLRASDNLLVIEGVQEGIPHTRRAPIAMLAVLAFVVTAVIAPTQVHLIALVAGLIMVIGRCLTPGEAYAAFDWDVLFLLGGTLALGHSFEVTGLAATSAEGVVALCGPMGQHAMVGGIFLFTMIMTQVMSNNAAAAMLTPIAYTTGLTFPGADGPMPFVMAVAFGASCCFLTPIGYQTNLLVYGPGGYKFTDFMRIGLPLSLIFLVIATLCLPIIY